MEANRKAYIDAVAGIMIIWMVLGHCNHFSNYCPCAMGNTYKLLGFYMPWFFYKSGTFFSNKGQIELLKKDTSKYLRYFGVYSLIGWLVWSILGLISQPLKTRA